MVKKYHAGNFILQCPGEEQMLLMIFRRRRIELQFNFKYLSFSNGTVATDNLN